MRFNRVVYIGTFAKVLFPAMRLGFHGGAGGDAEGVIAAVLSVTGQFAPLLTQAALADFINEGHFTRHLRRMRRLYATRRQFFIELCDYAPRRMAHTSAAPKSGIQLVGLFREVLDDHAIARAAQRTGRQCFAALDPVSPRQSEARACDGIRRRR